MRPGNAEVDDLQQGVLHRARCKRLQGIPGPVAVQAGARHRFLQGAVTPQDGARCFEIVVRDLAEFERPRPKAALATRGTTHRQDDGQRDLALAEIVADILAQIAASPP